MENIYGLLVGVAMGFLIQRVRASSPSMILRNLRLENLSVIKFMGVTIAVTMITVYTLSLFVPQALHFDIKPAYVLGVLLGGLIFGVGFGLGGYCPGTCVVGIGEGRRDALAALGGGVVGTLVFTLIYTSVVQPVVQVMDYGRVTIHGALGVPAIGTALAVGLLFLVMIRWLPTERKKT